MIANTAAPWNAMLAQIGLLTVEEALPVIEAPVSAKRGNIMDDKNPSMEDLFLAVFEGVELK